MKKTVIFGAGFYGRLAFRQLDADDVAFFIDNNEERHGSTFCGKVVKSPKVLLDGGDGYHVLVASLFQDSMKEELDRMGITDYSFYFEKIHGYYGSGQLIVNPYEDNAEAGNEEMWSGSKKLERDRQEVNLAVERIHGRKMLFDHIEIETINRCNGSCSFCPVNKHVDPREKAVMPEQLFRLIVDQLEDIRYSGKFTTFSNNEPLLDDRIIDFNRYAREHLPGARMHLYTNGTLLTMDKFLALVDILDELIIDNYTRDLSLIRTCEDIRDYCSRHPDLASKVTIVLRKPDEILTTRGGNAPNRKRLVEYPKDRCILPFKQIIVRPTGKVSLCCNDALGRYSLGDLTKEKLLDIWYGERFRTVRECLYAGRENWGDCRYCDTFYMG